MPPDKKIGPTGESGRFLEAHGRGFTTNVQSGTAGGRNWRDLWGPMRAEAMARSAERRQRVLAHPDLAVRLTRHPIGYERPDQWTGYVPPRMVSARDWWELNLDPRRRALAEICAEAASREGGDCRALDVT